MFKWVKLGLASVTGIFIIVGIIIGIALTVIFNLYVDLQQNEINPFASTTKSKDKAKSSIIDEDKRFDEKEESLFKKGILSNDKFEKLQKRIDYNTAVKILGGSGTLESEKKSRGVHSLTFEFKEDSDGILISLVFVNNELEHKNYYNYPRSTPGKIITADLFDQVKTGMTYDELIKVVGGEGLLRSSSGFSDEEYSRQSYEFKGEFNHSSADFTFEEGKLLSKSQYGL